MRGNLSRARGFLLLLLAGLLAACARVELPPVGPVPPTLPFMDSQQLRSALEKQKKIHSVAALANYFLRSGGRRLSGQEALVVQGPEAMRLEVLSPLGQPILYLVTRAGRFSAYAVSSNRYVTGRAIPFNMNRILGFPLNVSEINQLIRSDVTGDPGAQWGPLGYDPARHSYVVDLNFPTGERERLWIDPTRLTAQRVERLDQNGDPVLEADLKDYTAVSGILFPYRLDLAFPSNDTRLSLIYQQVTLNEPTDPSLFELTPPPGSRATDLD